MSVINRMLSDLERRGAPTELHSDPAMVADRPRARGRWRALLTRGFPIVLATVLVAIAAALWIERGPRLLAGLAGSGAPAGTASARPELIGLAFEGEARRPRLVLQLDGALERVPRYSRSGGHATLSLDARASELSLPAPPSAQEVFRGITLEPAGGGRTRLRLDVAPEAGLELHADGNRVVLTGRLPEPAAAEAARDPATGDVDAAASGGAGAGGQSASDGRETAARDPGPAGAGDAAAVRPAESIDGGDESATRAAQPTGAGATPVAVAPDRTEAEASARRGAGEHPERTGPEVGAGRQAPTQGGVDATASQTVRKAPSLSPEMRARRRYRDGRRALADGELSEARRLLDTALELDPALHAARDLLVSLARRAGATDTARALLLDGVELAPERVKFALPLARLLVDVGELDRAAGVLARARTTGAGNAGYHALTAAVAQRRGQHRQAAREYTRALELDAGNGLWWLGLGISLAAAGNPDEARAALNEARASGDLSEGLDRWAQGRIDELDDGREG